MLSAPRYEQYPSTVNPLWQIHSCTISRYGQYPKYSKLLCGRFTHYIQFTPIRVQHKICISSSFYPFEIEKLSLVYFKIVDMKTSQYGMLVKQRKHFQNIVNNLKLFKCLRYTVYYTFNDECLKNTNIIV